MKRVTITVIGSNNMDLITYMDRMPQEGETVFGRDFEIGFGGKGANQAVACARLGAQVHMVTKVGQDIFGPEVIKNFEKNAVNVDLIESIQGVSSGVAPIFVDQRGNNRIFVIKGANDRVDNEAVDRARNRIAKSDFLLMQLEIPVETVYYAIKVAREVNTRVILNPAPASHLDEECLKGIFLFAPNESEIKSLTGEHIESLQHMKEIAKSFVNKGVKNIVVTLGERGALIVNSETVEIIPTRKITPVDTTGAGDAFIGSLAVFLGEGQQLKRAVRLANDYAAWSTLKRGTQKSFLNRDEYTQQRERGE